MALTGTGAAWAHVGEGGPQHAATSWPLAPEVLIGVALAAIFYAVGWRRRRGRAGAVSGWRHLAFFAGLAALLAALQSPLDVLAEHSFTMHQVQHMLLRAAGPMLIMLAAPQILLIAGLPEVLRVRVVAPLMASTVAGGVFGFFAHPFTATFLMLAVQAFWHLPAYHNLSVLDAPVHYVMHITMLVSGLFFFWRVLDPRPAPQGATYGTRIVMCWAAIAGNVPLGAYLTLKSVELYPAYEAKGRLWDLAAMADEQMGGMVIWSPGSMMFLVLLLVVIGRWGARERRLDEIGRHGESAMPPRSSVAAANRRLALRLAAIAALVGAGVGAIAVLRQLVP